MAMDIREPVVQGMFYPSKKDTLSKMIGGFIVECSPEERKDNELIGFIVPHAGYIYSGPCAAYAYKLLKSRIVKAT